MIARKYRFHGLSSLKRVYQQGRQVRSPLMGLKLISNERRHDYRAAVVVSRKVNKSAVTRNRIRRRVYEQLRLLEPPLQQPLDIVFTVYSDQVAEMPIAELQKLIHDLLQRASAKPPA